MAHDDMLNRLLRARGLTRYEIFGAVGEGREMPNGQEEESGYVIESDGRVFFWWIGWDSDRDHPKFKYWDEASPDSSWADDTEYTRARERLGMRALAG